MENINVNQRLTEIIEKIAKGKNYLAPGIVVAIADAESKARVKVRIPHLHGYCDADGKNCESEVIPNDKLPFATVPLLKNSPPNAQNNYEQYFKGDHVLIRVDGDFYAIVEKIKPLPGMGGKEKENTSNSLLNDKLVQDCEGSFVTDSASGRDCCTVITESAKIKQNGENIPGADRCGAGGKLKDGITAEIADFMKIVQSTKGKIGSQFVSGITGELFSMASYIQKYTASILGVLRSAINWIKAIITKYARQAIDKLVKAIMRPIKGLTKQIDKLIEQILQMIACSFGNLEGLLQNLLEDLLNSLLDTALNAVFGCLDPLIDGILNTILGSVSDLLDSILGAISSIAGLIGSFGDMFGQALSSILDFLGINCGGAGDCNTTGQSTLVSKFNSPGEYGMTFGLSKSLNTGLSAIDGITSGIVTGVNGIDAAIAAGNKFAAGVSLATSPFPSVSTSNPALVHAFSVAQGILGPAVSSVFSFCTAPPTTAAILGTTVDTVSTYMITAEKGGVTTTGSGITYTITRDNTKTDGAINVVAYRSSADNIRLTGPQRDVDILNALSPADFIDGEPTNPFDIINPSVALGFTSTVTASTVTHFGTNIFHSRRVTFKAGESTKKITIPTRNALPALTGYSGPGLYLDLTSRTGNVLIPFTALGNSPNTYTINIPGTTVLGAPIPPINKPSGSAPVNTTVTLEGGRVYGPITMSGPGTLYLGTENPPGLPGWYDRGRRQLVIQDGGDDWDDMVLETGDGFFVRATSLASFFAPFTDRTYRVSLFRDKNDLKGYNFSDGRECTHVPNSSSALNTAVATIEFPDRVPFTIAAVTPSTPATPTPTPTPTPSGAPVVPPAGGGPIPSGVVAPAGPLVAPSGTTLLSYFSTNYSVTAGNPIVMNITRTPATATASRIRYTLSGITAVNNIHYSGGTETGVIDYDPTSAPPTGDLRTLVIPTIPFTTVSSFTLNVNIRDEIVPAGFTSTLGTFPGRDFTMTILPSGASAGPVTCAAAIVFTATPPTCIVQPDTNPLSLGVVANTTVPGYTLTYQWQRTLTPTTSTSWTNITDGAFNTIVPVSTPTPIILASGVTPSGVPFVISGWTTTIVNTAASCTFSGATSPTLVINPLSHLINDQEYYRCQVIATPAVPSLITPVLAPALSPNTFLGVTSSGVFNTSVNCSPVPPSGGSVIVYSGVAPAVGGPIAPAAGFCSATPIPGFLAPPAALPTGFVIPSGLIVPVVLPATTTIPPVIPPPPVPTPAPAPATPVALPPPPPAAPTTGPAIPTGGAFVTTPIVGPGGGIVSVPIPAGLPPFVAPPLVPITGGGFGAIARAVLDTRGYIERIVVTSPGFGYSPNNNDNLCGILDSIELTNVGGYYESSPTVYVDGDPDVAVAAIDESGRVVDIRITNPKDKVYDYIPTIEIQGGGGLGASALAIIRYVDCATVADEYLNVVNKYNTRRIGTVRVVDCP